MKKFTLIALWAVAVVGLLSNCKSNTSGKATKDANQSNSQISSSFTAAWVNVDSLINNYDMYFDMQKELEESGRKSEAELTTKSRDFEREATDFQNKVQKGLVTRSEAEKLQQGLAVKEQELYRLRDELRAKIAEEQQVKLRLIQVSITDFLVEYNKTKGYHVILSSTFGGPLLYGHPSLDITQDVLKGLNEKYSSTRKNK